ncbi:hypothetical protein EDC04DRAFT_2599256 [Pisolithus marmoratus]|nr:hypothetical protein EDC04DRAFT_2599256 [Pisolithus marmoratus]
MADSLVMHFGQRVELQGFLVYVPLRDMSIGDISLMAPKFEGFTDDTGQAVHAVVQRLIPLIPYTLRGFRLWWRPMGSRPLPYESAISVAHMHFIRTRAEQDLSHSNTAQLDSQKLGNQGSPLHPYTALSSRGAPATTVVAIGHRDLEGIDDQLDFVKNGIPLVVSFKCIEGEAASNWVHFACPVLYLYDRFEDAGREFNSVCHHISNCQKRLRFGWRLDELAYLVAVHRILKKVTSPRFGPWTRR